MKHSKYNILIPAKGFCIIYNSFTDKFVGLSNRIATEFNETKDFSEFHYNHKAVFENLKSLGMIIDDDTNELSIIKSNYDKAVRGDDSLYIMIYPTQDCNLKCWYCYESHVANSLMSPKVMQTTYNAVINKLKTKHYESLLIGFFGGEPLTNFDDIAYPLSIRIKEFAESNGIKFSTFFVTNASLINEDMIGKLHDINPLFQITLDGTKEKHDSVRIWKKDNKGTYDTIINAVKIISNSIKNTFTDDPTVTIRINYDNQTLRKIDSLIADLEGVNKNNVIIHFERVWQTRHLVDDEQRELLIDTFRKFINAGYTITHGVFRRKKVSCPSDTHDFMIVNYNGKLYKCNGRTLTPETSEGLLTDEGGILWDEKKIRKRINKPTFDNARCLNCKILPLCLGPCSQKLLETGQICIIAKTKCAFFQNEMCIFCVFSRFPSSFLMGF